MTDDRGAMIGAGILRRRPDGQAGSEYAGEITIAGFPYIIEASIGFGGDNRRYFALRAFYSPIPAELRLPLIDDEPLP